MSWSPTGAICSNSKNNNNNCVGCCQLPQPTFSYSFMKYCSVPLRLYPLAKVGASSMHLTGTEGRG